FVLQLTLVGCGAQMHPSTAPAPAHVDASLDPVLPDLHDPIALTQMTQRVVDTMVRWEIGVRDLFRGAAESLADKLGSLAPDLSVLTTDPIASMRTDQSSGFGWRDDPIHKRRRQFHSGADFRSQPGTPVLAAGNGVVVFTGWYYGYGNMIDIDHGGGVITRYAHLSRIETKKDATIRAGEQIGRVGMTGRTTGPHLHFEVRLDQRPVSPVTAMTVANLQRQSPTAGRVAAFALSPDLQSTALDGEDDSNRSTTRVKESRPERPNRTKRSQVLW
ncbi:MAG TPA: M23 family metallopeptidase, partial [Kofleriaceae bacterium]|nr:M23 family metallopeptidase [Kofleriaceae bacterium]